MRTGLIAKKLGMSSMFTSQGNRITLTLLQLEDLQVVGQKSTARDGYNAVVLGSTIVKRISKLSKPIREAFAKQQVEPRKILKEFRVSKNNLLDIGVKLDVNHFKIGQYVDISGRSIGKGFSGVMKRHNFAGLEATHGVSISHRSHGSTGQCQDPGKVFKGKKMSGHLGNANVTIQNLRIVELNSKNGVVLVSGNVPGSKGQYVLIKDAIKKIVNT